MAWGRCLLVVLLTMPTVVVLSICMGVDGCKWPSSLRTSCDTLFSCALRKSLPSSASAADTATSFRMVHVIWMAPLMIIGSESRGILQRKKTTSCMTLCLGGTEVEGIQVYIQYHVRRSVSDFCIWVCPYVVKELVDAHKVFFSQGILLHGNGWHCHENGWVICVGVV